MPGKGVVNWELTFPQQVPDNDHPAAM